MFVTPFLSIGSVTKIINSPFVKAFKQKLDFLGNMYLGQRFRLAVGDLRSCFITT